MSKFLLQIDPRSATPLYAQIISQIQTMIGSQALQPGDRLPTVRELAAELSMNRNTVAKAYRLMEHDGLIETRRGGGTRVAQSAPRYTRAERRQRIEAALDRLMIEARQLGVSAAELRKGIEARLRERLEAERDVS